MTVQHVDRIPVGSVKVPDGLSAFVTRLGESTPRRSLVIYSHGHRVNGYTYFVPAWLFELLVDPRIVGWVKATPEAALWGLRILAEQWVWIEAALSLQRTVDAWAAVDFIRVLARARVGLDDDEDPNDDCFAWTKRVMAGRVPWIPVITAVDLARKP